MPRPIFFEGWAAHNLLPRLRSRRLGEDEFDRRTKKEGSLHVRRTALCWERSDPPRHFVTLPPERRQRGVGFGRGGRNG